MPRLRTRSTSKLLRSSVTGLVRDAEEHLPKEFHSRLRLVSKLFFEHRRESSQLVENIEAAQRRVQALEQQIATQQRDQAALQIEIEQSRREIASLNSKLRERDVALQQLERDHAFELKQQKQKEMSVRHAIDELLLRLGDVAQGKHACTVISVVKSSTVEKRLRNGNLKQPQVEQAIRRAVGFYVSQSEPDDCLYDWYPTDLRAVIRANGQTPAELSIEMDSTASQDKCERNRVDGIEEGRDESTRTNKRMSTKITDWLDNTPLDDQTVNMYERRLRSGEQLPATVVWEHDGKSTVIDGRHRLMAMVRCGFEEFTGYYTVSCTPEKAAELRRKLNSKSSKMDRCDISTMADDMGSISDQVIANPPFGNRNRGGY